jgi:hypothetical protein
VTKLFLPDVTLVCIETLDHALARLAIEDCVRKVEFGAVQIFTDKPEAFGELQAEYNHVPNWPEKKGWSSFLWGGVAPYLRTTHVLSIQWDSWVVDTSMWASGYLDFDYIGAPWWYSDFKNVGNCGFSIRSTRLTRFLATHQTEFPCDTDLDDDLLCRKYRPKLEARGFTWAPENLARDFAFECVRPAPDSRHFGFHAAFNFPHVLEREPLLERVRLMKASPYVSGSYIWNNFCKAYPDLA